jgi:hypothetical protein
MGSIKNVFKISAGKPHGKSPYERPRHRQEDNIKINLKEAG